MNMQSTTNSLKNTDDNDFINTYSLKDRLFDLEGQLNDILMTVNTHKTEGKQLMIQKLAISEMLNTKSNDVEITLLEEINKVDTEINKHFHHQNIENKRIKDHITKVKTENTALHNQLKYLEKRIDQMWKLVGVEINPDLVSSDIK